MKQMDDAFSFRGKGQQLEMRLHPTRGRETEAIYREAVRKLLSELDVRAIDAQLNALPGSDFAHVRHTLVTPAFAPIKSITAINRLLERFPFEQNVFLMTRFPEDASDTHYLDPVRELIPCCAMRCRLMV